MKAEWDTLLAQWNVGKRTREVALRLLFLSWYSCSEPPYLSGLEGITQPDGLIEELFEHLGGEETQDAEVWFVVKVMGEVAPWCLGDEQRWERITGIFSSRLAGSIPSWEVFGGRGDYGEYFAHQARFQSQYGV